MLFIQLLQKQNKRPQLNTEPLNLYHTTSEFEYTHIIRVNSGNFSASNFIKDKHYIANIKLDGNIYPVPEDIFPYQETNGRRTFKR